MTHAAFIRKSVLQIQRAERMRPHTRRIEIWKASSRPVPRCRLDVDASESLPKSAVSSARFLPTKRNQLHESKNMEYHKRPTNARNVSFRVAKMAPLPIHWPACHSCNHSGNRVRDFMFELICLHGVSAHTAHVRGRL